MDIQWKHLGVYHREAIAPVVVPYIEALGFETAANLFIELGGSSVYIKSGNGPTKSRIGAIIGQQMIAPLREALGGYGEYTVPVARKFLCIYYRSTGLSIAAIARKTRVTESTVRRYCTGSKPKEKSRSLKASKGRAAI